LQSKSLFSHKSGNDDSVSSLSSLRDAQNMQKFIFREMELEEKQFKFKSWMDFFLLWFDFKDVGIAVCCGSMSSGFLVCLWVFRGYDLDFYH